ncbi:hypothetical protein TCAL_01487 [Tigriopus californicus]|uniref:Uncharacterized protein n=1 Tax=Tigriopus californicus TaxID=6832 RepID=A0A553N6Z0_TIGCA|nr:hypothetical protein TCAL_01487 [Tigriopus californicus]|eukprot:TCALIF_01487-PA protein Name:"Protein of unknown function" AED:0.57 eAED:0.57 QI:16/1/0.66/1/0.5/0.66/3/0/121
MKATVLPLAILLLFHIIRPSSTKVMVRDPNIEHLKHPAFGPYTLEEYIAQVPPSVMKLVITDFDKHLVKLFRTIPTYKLVNDPLWLQLLSVRMYLSEHFRVPDIRKVLMSQREYLRIPTIG